MQVSFILLHRFGGFHPSQRDSPGIPNFFQHPHSLLCSFIHSFPLLLFFLYIYYFQAPRPPKAYGDNNTRRMGKQNFSCHIPNTVVGKSTTSLPCEIALKFDIRSVEGLQWHVSWLVMVKPQEVHICVEIELIVGSWVWQ